MGGNILGRASLVVLIAGTLFLGADSGEVQATESVRSVSSRMSVEHSTSVPVVVRQILGYGRQSTWIAGIRTASRGSATFDRTRQVKTRLGSGWTCRNGVLSWRRDAVILTIKTLMGPPARCAPDGAAITNVHVNARGGRLVTEAGTVRVGQTWRSVPKPLKARVVRVVRANRWEGGGTIYWAGRFQDACGRRRADPHDKQPLLAIGVTRTGVVEFFSVEQRIVEGIDCP